MHKNVTPAICRRGATKNFVIFLLLGYRICIGVYVQGSQKMELLKAYDCDGFSSEVRDHEILEVMNTRWKIFRFHAQIPKEKQKQLRPCGKCFATLILAPQGDEYL